MNNISLVMRAVRGPVLLMTIGLLFVAEFFGSVSFSRTWPVLLIVYGALKLAERLTARTDGDAMAGGAQ